MNITIKQNGFVTGDFLEPVAYAGEVNSRVLNIVHPTFENAFYQLLVIKDNRPYVLGIDNGKVIIPPSLTDIATTLQCQFLATRKNENIDTSTNTCDCYPDSTNDCRHMIFKSDKFTLKVAEGLNLNGLTPIPPYEQLVEIYNNINKAKLVVEQAKADNLKLLDIINDRITILQRENNNINANIATNKETEEMIDDVFIRNKNLLSLQSNSKIASDNEIKEMLNDTFGF